MSFIINNVFSFLKSDLITYCLSFIWIISFALIFCFFFNKKIKDTLVLSFIASFVFLFFGGLVNNIFIFYIIGWLVIFCFYIFVIFKKRFSNLFKEIDYNTIFIYLLLSLIIYIIYQSVGFRFIDEFMHWGPMVKEMFKTNGFYCSNESVLLVHKDYPPFFSLIELLFCLFGRSYAEKYLYIGLLSFVASIFVCISFNSKNKGLSMLGLILIGFVFQYIPSIQDNTSIYNSVYIDYALSLLFVYVVVYITSIDKCDDFVYKNLALCLTVLLLSKQIGILYFGICVVYLSLFVKEKDIKSIICFAMPIIFFLIWKVIVKTNGISGQFSFNNVSIRKEALTIFKLYLDAIINKPLFIKPISINTLFSLIGTVAILFLADKTKNKRIAIIYSVCFVLYLITICILYMFVFSVEEALVLSSFERYIVSYVYVGFALITVCIHNLNKVLFYICYFVIVILLCDFGNADINKPLDQKHILVINQQGANVEFTNHTKGSIYIFDICDYINEEDINTFRDKLDKYDYIYVYLYDDGFYRIWVNLTNDDSLENDQLFYIEQHDPLTLINSDYNTIYYVSKYCLNNYDE